ncbi:hypothetical protein N5863_29015 (plasmid) [Klebsiella pasteurii]|uniref:fimbrial protein n=1 Tax=Klebsiella pasteurii TaxID=2587529 RepID=UPI002542ABC9|nr:hypothetical protein [Klebsiella pasteurii]WII85136.1 hypothetical protein N5863_29015 [Klebsiella pasteurii]
MKALLKITAVAAIVVGGMTSAYANGTDAHVEITGNVVPVTCNLGPGGNAPSNIFLGNAAPEEFVSGSGIYSSLYTVANSKKTFQVTVNGCSGVTPSEGNTLNIRVNANGKTMNTEQTIFGGGAGQSSDAGASLATIGPDAQLLADGDEVVAYTYKDNEPADAANGAFVQLETMMASSSKTPAIGGINAPVTFTVAYK